MRVETPNTGYFSRSTVRVWVDYTHSMQASVYYGEPSSHTYRDREYNLPSSQDAAAPGLASNPPPWPQLLPSLPHPTTIPGNKQHVTTVIAIEVRHTPQCVPVWIGLQPLWLQALSDRGDIVYTLTRSHTVDSSSLGLSSICVGGQCNWRSVEEPSG